MIEVVSAERCTGCNICIKICPTNVFDEGLGDIPVVARQEDCQTCFQCEAYCPADALFVAPYRTPAEPGSEWRDEAALILHNQLGLYRARVGLNKQNVPELPSDAEFFAVMQAVPRR
jgi:NAD-dependent dihydropyrimidine dehydrogenase PreA subunit